EGIDPSDIVEIGAHCDSYFFGASADTVREDGPLEDVECKAGHVGRDLDRSLAIVVAPACDQDLRGLDHARGKPRYRFLRKERRKRTALNAPALVFGHEETIAERRRHHPALKRVLPVIGGVLVEHAANGLGLAEERNVANRQLGRYYRFCEMGLAPCLERVFPK